MDEKAVAYFAGLFDGDGSVELRLRKTRDGGCRVYSTLRITSADLDTLEWIQATFGGSIYSDARMGKVHTYWLWQSTGSKKALRLFLITLLPYLRAKRELVMVALKALSLPENQKTPEATAHYWQEAQSLILEARSKRIDQYSRSLQNKLQYKGNWGRAKA